MLTAATVASTKAFAVMISKFALYAAALKIGWELGKLIHRQFSDRHIIKEHIDAATKATEKLNKEFARFIKQTSNANKFNVGDFLQKQPVSD